MRGILPTSVVHTKITFRVVELLMLRSVGMSMSVASRFCHVFQNKKKSTRPLHCLHFDIHMFSLTKNIWFYDHFLVTLHFLDVKIYSVGFCKLYCHMDKFHAWNKHIRVMNDLYLVKTALKNDI